MQLEETATRGRERHDPAPGDVARVTVEASNPHNETGLSMVAGQRYTARCIRCVGWKDGSYDATPAGVEFKGLARFLARLFECRRPYPRGNWFEVVGRVDNGSTFQVLANPDASIPREFEAPNSGELVLMVNDVLYCNNKGVMTIEIRKV